MHRDRLLIFKARFLVMVVLAIAIVCCGHSTQDISFKAVLLDSRLWDVDLLINLVNECNHSQGPSRLTGNIIYYLCW